MSDCSSDEVLWTESFRVRAYEIGPDEYASVLTLCDYFQEAAGNHASSYGVEQFDLDGRPGAWVMHRLAFELFERPARRETVTVTTWPSGLDGLRAERDFVMTGADGRELMRGTSVWFVIDVKRRRPVRLPASVSGFKADRDRAMQPPAEAPGPPTQTDVEARFHVRRSDLDRNGHANNVRFIEWALEAGPPNRPLTSLDVIFRAEAVFGDLILSRARERGAISHHALLRERDGAALAHLRATWGAPAPTLSPTFDL